MFLAFDAGAYGFLLKRSATAELPQVHVFAGDRYIGQGIRDGRAFADEGEFLIRYRLRGVEL